MKGLIIKDFITMFKRIRPMNYLLIAAATVFILIYFKGEGALYVAVFLPVVLSGVPKTLMVYDEQCKWDKYAIALPMTRKSIIGSRYLFFLMTAVAASVIAFFISVISCIFFPNEGFSPYLIAGISGLLLAIFYGMITIPAGYSMGTNGGPLAMLLTTFLLMGAFYVLKRLNVDIEALLVYLKDNLLLTGAVFLIILGVISYNASLYFYNQKHS